MLARFVGILNQSIHPAEYSRVLSEYLVSIWRSANAFQPQKALASAFTPWSGGARPFDDGLVVVVMFRINLLRFGCPSSGLTDARIGSDLHGSMIALFTQIGVSDRMDYSCLARGGSENISPRTNRLRTLQTLFPSISSNLAETYSWWDALRFDSSRFAGGNASNGHTINVNSTSSLRRLRWQDSPVNIRQRLNVLSSHLRDFQSINLTSPIDPELAGIYLAQTGIMKSIGPKRQRA